MLATRPFRPIGGAWKAPHAQSLIYDGSAYFSRTPSVAGNRQKWTWAGWVYFVAGGSDVTFFSSSSVSRVQLLMTASGALRMDRNGATGVLTTRLFRDTGFYHVTFVLDTTDVTASERQRYVVNGDRAATTTNLDPGLNAQLSINNTEAHNIGRDAESGNRIFKGAMCDVHFLDGAALTDAQINSIFLSDEGNAGLAPKLVEGLTYGTNGFNQKYDITGDYGGDSSGNGNNFTATGFVSADQITSVPGDPFSVMSALNRGPSTTVTNGGLTCTSSGDDSVLASMWFDNSGKSFGIEVKVTGSQYRLVGLANGGHGPDSVQATGMYDEGTFWKSSDGNVYIDGVAQGTNYGTYGDADTVEILSDGNSVWFLKNGVSISGDHLAKTGGFSLTQAGSLHTLKVACHAGSGTCTFNVDFGQKGYVPPAGFLPLRASNLPTQSAPSDPDTGSFPGNANATGPVVYLGYAPSEVDALTINGNLVTWNTHAFVTADGFRLITSSSSYNSSGNNTWSLVTANAEYGGGDKPWPLGR